MTYTEEDLLRIWALRRHCIDTRLDMTVTRPAGSPDIEIMKEEMKAWYNDIIISAPLNYLDPEDLAPQCTISPEDPAIGIYSITVPKHTVRFAGLQIRTSFGIRPVRIVMEGSVDALLQLNRHSMAGARFPIAVEPPVGSRTMILYAKEPIVSKTPELVYFPGIRNSPDSVAYPYLTPATLSLIPKLENTP